MIGLRFTSQLIAELNEGQISLNYARKHWGKAPMIDKDNNIIPTFEDFYALSNEDKRLCKMVYTNDPTLQRAGYSVRYAIPLPIYQTTDYWIPKPDDTDLMLYVEGYTEEEVQDNWFEPREV